MNFIHKGSQECTKSELDLFSVPPTQVSLERGQWIDHQPVSSLSDGGAITFMSPGTEEYVDLSKTILVVRGKVLKADGTAIGGAEKVGVVNNLMHSLFKQVDVFLKEQQVTQATGTYPYRAYLETLLNYGPDAKKSQLTAGLFYKDKAGKMDVADPTAADRNTGLKARYAFSKASQSIEMAGPVFSDVFFTDRLLLSFVDVKVVLNRTGNPFCLMALEDGANYRMKLTKVILKLRKVKVSPTVSVAHEVALKSGPAIYPIRRVECESLIVPAGNPSLRKDNLFNGLVPKSFIFGLVDSKAFNGHYKKNPYNFQHFDVSFVGVSVNRVSIPFKLLYLSFAASAPLYIEAYLALFSGTGKISFNTGNDIARNEFPNMFALYCVDLSPDMCGSSSHFNAVQRENLALDIKFSTASGATVNFICYGEFENLIQIDAERNVVYDYSG